MCNNSTFLMLNTVECSFTFVEISRYISKINIHLLSDLNIYSLLFVALMFLIKSADLIKQR